MNPKEPDFYADILIWDETRVSETTTRFGGRFSEPLLSYSYLLGARRLIASATTARLDVLAAPIAYLQRHAFEVALKGLTAAAYKLERDRVWLSELRRDPGTAKLPERKKPVFTHHFGVLVDELEKALKAIDHDPRTLLVRLRETGERLAKLEQTGPTHFRYGGFTKPATLELGGLQTALEELFAQEMWIRDSDHIEHLDTVWADMAIESHQLGREIYAIEDRNGMTKPVTNFDDWV